MIGDTMSNPPAVKAERYYVYLDDPEESYEARLLWGDNLRAELEASKRGVKPQQQPMLYLTLTVWCHAVRTGLTDQKFDEWRARIVDLDDAAKRDQRDGQAVDDDEANPTNPG
jgi:hypothetical protein